MLTYKPSVGRQDLNRIHPGPLPPPFVCSQSMLSYMSTTATDVGLSQLSRPSDVASTDPELKHGNPKKECRSRPPSSSSSILDSTDSSTPFPWRPLGTASSDNDHQRHGIGGLFQPTLQTPLTLSEYSPSSPYSPYFGSTVGGSCSAPTTPSATSTSRYFFPFPPPPPPPPLSNLPSHPIQSPSRHYLQIESYSSILSSMGGGSPLQSHQIHHQSTGQPTRPTPIFSSAGSSTTTQPQFGILAPPAIIPPLSHGPHMQVHFSPNTGSNIGFNSGLYMNRSALPNCTSSPPPNISSRENADLLSPCQSPSYNVNRGGPYPQGSLKHRILVRPESKDQQSDNVHITSIKRSRLSPSSKLSSTGRTVLSGLATSGSHVPTGVQVKFSTDLQQQQQQLRYPAHFMKGSIIQLANGELRRVEDLRTEDFVSSADQSDNLRIDSSTVVRIDEQQQQQQQQQHDGSDNSGSNTAALTFLVGHQRIKVTVDASLEHPFFVFGHGWSSCCPERTMKRYALHCHRLQVGDVCISLTHRHRSEERPQSPVTNTNVGRTSVVPLNGYDTKPHNKSALLLSDRLPTRKRRWSASDALNAALNSNSNSTSDQRSLSLADPVIDNCLF